MQKITISKTISIVFSCVFVLMLLVPLLNTNMADRKISEAENRYLAAKPVLLDEEGFLNEHFLTDFETWINDNIGFRSEMVIHNAKAQYHLFNVLSNNSDMYLGPKGELNYATGAMLADYQHNNLYDQEYLNKFAQSMQTISDYVEAHGRRFYYFQCWDKHSIYPEQFPESVIQHGTVSKTDMLVRTLEENTSVSVVSPKAQLIAEKENHNTYSRWGDASHWTMRGAITGYNQLLEAMNKREGTNYHLLTDDDYNIEMMDQGETLFGGIHETDYEEAFGFKEYEATDRHDLLTLFADDPRSACLMNPLAENDKTVLLIADSYFAGYCIWDFVYTFKNVFFIHADHLGELPRIMEAYPSEYVILERAERVDCSQDVISVAGTIGELDQLYLSFDTDALLSDEDQLYAGKIVLHPGHIQYGPYTPIPKGKYKIVLYGSGLNALNEECLYINPNAWFSVIPENTVISDERIEYTVEFVDELYNLELGIKNSTDSTIEIYKTEVYLWDKEVGHMRPKKADEYCNLHGLRKAEI